MATLNSQSKHQRRRKPNSMQLLWLFALLSVDLISAQDCTNPEKLRAKRPDVPDHTYDFTFNSVVLEPGEFTTTPAGCPVTYSCETIVPVGGSDLCTISGGFSSSIFDTTTGILQLTSLVVSDIPSFPEVPEYQVEITGTFGTNQKSNKFTVILYNPCLDNVPGQDHALIVDDPFPTLYTHFVIDDPLKQFEFDRYAIGDARTMLTLTCGAYTVEFFDADTGIALSSPFFYPVQVGATDTEMALEISPDVTVADVGTYSLFYVITMEQWPTQTATSETFQIVLEDGCVDYASVVLPAEQLLQSITYTIGAPAEIHFIPEFTVLPARCSLTYSVEIDNVDGFQAIEFINDIAFRYLKVENNVDAGLAGVYRVTITVLPGFSTSAEYSFFIDVTLKNPCLDPALISIQPSTVDPVGYTIYGQELSVPIDPFPVTADGIDPTLCGQMKYEGFYDGNPLFSTSQPFKFFGFYFYINVFVRSTDMSLLLLESPQVITVDGFFVDYPDSRVSTTIEVTFLDPCEDPDAFEVFMIPQTFPADYYYSVAPATFTMTNPFEIPRVCPPQWYACEVIDGARTDLCDFNDGETVAIFDPTTGNYSFKSFNLVDFPEGVYNFQITIAYGSDPDAPSKTVTSLFDLTLTNPCHTHQLQVSPTFPFSDQVLYYFKPTIKVEYNVQDLAYYQLPVDCGLYTVSFATTSGVLDTVVLDDGLSVDPSGVDEGREDRVFSIIETLDAVYRNVFYDIVVTTSLVDYPENKGVVKDFRVSISIEDYCVFRLVQEGILSSLPDRCSEPAPVEEVVEVIEEVDEEEEPIQARQTIFPAWLANVKNQRMTYGGDSLIYELGDALSYYGDEMTVTVDFGDLFFPTWYEEETNTIFVIAQRFSRSHIGYWRIQINATYTELDDSEVSFEKTIYLRIDPPKQESQGIPVTPVVQPLPGRVDLPGRNGETSEIKIFSDEELDKLEFDVITTEIAAEKLAKDVADGGPMPYVKGFSFTGELRLGWDRQLVPFDSNEALSLPSQKIAIEKDVIESQSSGTALRRLQTGDDKVERLLLVKDAIEVKILREDNDNEGDDAAGPELSTGMTWQVADFSESEITLQFIFSEPETVSNRPASEFDTFQLTFWGTKFFKDQEQREIPLGTKIEWRVFRQVTQAKAEEVEAISASTNFLFYVIGLVIMLVALCMGPLLPIWMFFNSLQLIVHIPMIRANLPATANLFLLDLLSGVRLHVGALDQFFTEQLASDSDQIDFEAIRSPDVFYFNELVYSCGYHVSLIRNLFLIFLLFAVLALIWVIIACKESFVTCGACGCKGNRGRKHEVWWNNVIVRFLYEVFFEIVICLMLSFSVSGFGEVVGFWILLLTIGLTLIAVAILCLLSFLCIHKGPYMEGTYEKKSLAKSFWHFSNRRIRPELLELHHSGSTMCQKESKMHTDAVMPCSTHGNIRPLTVGSAPLAQDSILVESSSFLSSEGSRMDSCRSRPRSDSSRTLTPIPIRSLGLRSIQEVAHGYDEVDLGGRRTPQSYKSYQIHPVHPLGDFMEISGHQTVRNDKCSQTEHKFPDESLEKNKSPTTISEKRPPPKTEQSQDNGAEVQVIQYITEEQLPEVQHNSQILRFPAENDNRIDRELDFQPRQLELTIMSVSQPQIRGAQDEDDQYEGGAPAKCTIGTQTDDQMSKPAVKVKEFVRKMQDKYVLDATQKATLAVEAKVRLILEDTILLNPRYKTIFSGLKKNHSHNTALVHPMAFLLRRLVYAALVIFMVEMPLFVALALLLASLGFLAFVILEQHWEDGILNQQHMVNEVGLYLCLVFIFLLSGTVVPASAIDGLGWTLIGIVVVVCIYNCVIITVLSLNFFRQFILQVHKKMLVKNQMESNQKQPWLPKLPLVEKGLVNHSHQSRYWPAAPAQIMSSQRRLLIMDGSSSEMMEDSACGLGNRIPIQLDDPRASFMSSTTDKDCLNQLTIEEFKTETLGNGATSVTQKAGDRQLDSSIVTDEMLAFENERSRTDRQVCEQIALSVITTQRTRDQDGLERRISVDTPINVTLNQSQAEDTIYTSSFHQQIGQEPSEINFLEFGESLSALVSPTAIQELANATHDKSNRSNQSVAEAYIATLLGNQEYHQGMDDGVTPGARIVPPISVSVTIDDDSYFSQDLDQDGPCVEVSDSYALASSRGDAEKSDRISKCIDVTNSSALSSEQQVNGEACVEVSSDSENESAHVQVMPIVDLPLVSKVSDELVPTGKDGAQATSQVSVDDDFSINEPSLMSIAMRQATIQISSGDGTDSLVTEVDDDFSINDLEKFLDSSPLHEQTKTLGLDLPKKSQQEELTRKRVENGKFIGENIKLPQISSKEDAFGNLQKVLPELDNLVKEEPKQETISLSSSDPGLGLNEDEGAVSIEVSDDDFDSRNSREEVKPPREGGFMTNFVTTQSQEDFESLALEVEDALDNKKDRHGLHNLSSQDGGSGGHKSRGQFDQLRASHNSGFTADSAALSMKQGNLNNGLTSTPDSGRGQVQDQSFNSIPEAMEDFINLVYKDEQPKKVATTIPFEKEEKEPLKLENQKATPSFSNVLRGINVMSQQPQMVMAFGSEVIVDSLDPDSPKIPLKKQKPVKPPIKPKKVRRASADRKVKYQGTPIAGLVTRPAVKKKKGQSGAKTTQSRHQKQQQVSQNKKF